MSRGLSTSATNGIHEKEPPSFIGSVSKALVKEIREQLALYSYTFTTDVVRRYQEHRRLSFSAAQRQAGVSLKSDYEQKARALGSAVNYHVEIEEEICVVWPENTNKVAADQPSN